VGRAFHPKEKIVMHRFTFLGLSLFAVLACQSSGPVVVDTDPVHRETLFAPVRALAGTWRVDADEHPGEIRFEVTSGGSAVRELMFPGTEHEMTNMYSLDGNSIVMTHYCAGGNQPHMRATAIDGNRLVFESDGVSDLKKSDAQYMGAMTLVLVDEDHIEQHWVAYNAASEEEHPVFELTRVK
jgi:hypothetical protein